MDLQPLQKLIIYMDDKRQNARVIGIKPECDGSKSYMIEPLRIDFISFKNGSRIVKINSKDIEANKVKIEKH